MSRLAVAGIVLSALIALGDVCAADVASYQSFNAKSEVGCDVLTSADDLNATLIRIGWNNSFPEVDFDESFAVLVAKPGLKKNMALKRAVNEKDRLVIEWELHEIQGSRQGAGYADFGSSAALDLLLVVVPKDAAAPEKIICRGP